MTIRELQGGDSPLGDAAIFKRRGQRPPLASAEVFQVWVSEQTSQGDRLAACGFRVLTFLSSGRQLSTDDLSTRPTARGHARECLLQRFLAHRHSFKVELGTAAHPCAQNLL